MTIVWAELRAAADGSSFRAGRTPYINRYGEDRRATAGRDAIECETARGLVNALKVEFGALGRIRYANWNAARPAFTRAVVRAGASAETVDDLAASYLSPAFDDVFVEARS